MADELGTIARMRVETLRDALVSEAGKLMGADDSSAQAKELLPARTTMLNVRVTEILDHISKSGQPTHGFGYLPASRIQARSGQAEAYPAFLK